MKYFTPERFLKLQNFASEQAFRAATSEWEQAASAYEAHLREIGPVLPSGVRRFVELGSFHDAHVLAMWQAQTRLTIVLRRDGEASKACVLTYSLIGAPSINPSVLPEAYRSGEALWLYDEMGVDRNTASDSASATGRPKPGATVFTHDILLSNGWEVRLGFRRLEVARPTALIPGAPRPPAETQDLLRSTA